MNKAHRVIWSLARRAFVVVDEHASALGKPGKSHTLLASAVALAITQPGVAHAIDSVVSTTSPYTYNLGSDENLSILNTGKIQAAAGYGVSVNGIGDEASVTNAGKISGTRGISIGSGSTFAGNISNVGTITALGTGGNDAAIRVADGSVAGNIYNNGVLQGMRGVFIDGAEGSVTLNGNITNDAQGTISSNYTGMSAGSGAVVTGSIINRGTIIDSEYGMGVYSGTIGGDLVNAGIIHVASSAIFAVSSQIDGGITNTGTIVGGTYGIYTNLTTIAGNILNTGEISGGYAAIKLVGRALLSQNIINQGTLSGQYGIKLENASTVVGSITNSGKILGTTGGISISTGSTLSGGLTNSGTISGNTFAVNVDPTSTLNFINITGNNTAKFIGEVNAPNTEVIVAANSTYTLDDGNLFTVQNFKNSGTLAVEANGTATIVGDYTQRPSAVFRTDVINDTTYGKLVVDGAAILAPSAHIDVNVANPNYHFSVSQLDNVISATSLTTSGFVVTDNSQLFNFGAVQDGNSVDLTLTAASSSGALDAVNAEGNRQARGAASILDQAFAESPTATLSTLFTGLSSNQAVSNAVSQTLPLMTGATVLAAQSVTDSVNRVVQARLQSNLGLSSGDGFQGDDHLWLKPFGSWGDQDSRSGVSGFDVNTTGLAFGADAVVSGKTRLGLSFAYAKADTNSNSDNARQSAKIDLYQLTGYGSYSLADDTEVNFHAGIGQNRTDGKRSIDFGGASGTAKSNYNSWLATAGVGLGKEITLNAQTHFIPSVRADYTWIKDESYDEHGNTAIDPLLLSVNSRDTQQFIIGADGKLNYELKPGITLSVNGGVGYDLINDDSSLNSAYAGAPGQSFTTKGIDPSPWLVRGGAGIASVAANGMEVSLGYDIEGRSDFTNQTASVKVRWPF